MANVGPSKHAEKRIRQRMGVPRSAVKRIVQEAWDKGVTPEEAIGSLKTYLINGPPGRGKSGCVVRVHNRHVFIFRGDTLITILKLPSEFNALEDKLKKK